MSATARDVLVINGGSSSVKFALFRTGDALVRILHGAIERIGQSDCVLRASGSAPADVVEQAVDARDHRSAVDVLMSWLERRIDADAVLAIGHRIVHGGPRYSAPQRIDAAMLGEIRRLGPVDPAHVPAELLLIEAMQQRFPQLPQVACFDSAFHRDMPRVAQLLAIPRRYLAQGIRRYGFHGLSFQFLLDELTQAGQGTAPRRVILAHLGSGASLAAVLDGRCIDTSMGFTPAAGLPMATRAGDLDPGLCGYLARLEGMTSDAFDRMINSESGLLGLSGTSSDIRHLLAQESHDARAAEAVAFFCYQARKWIGAFAAALGGLDALVFAGGIGENSAVIRTRICAGLDFLGVTIDEPANAQGATVVSRAGSRVAVRVVRTDEALVMAREVVRCLAP